MNFAIEIKPSGELLLAIHDLADAIREHAAATNRAATAAELAVSRPVPVARQQVDIPTPSVVAKPIQVDALLPPVPGHRVHLLPDAPPLAFGASDSRLLTDARRVLLRELYPAGVAGTVIMAALNALPGRRFDSPDVVATRAAGIKLRRPPGFDSKTAPDTLIEALRMYPPRPAGPAVAAEPVVPAVDRIDAPAPCIDTPGRPATPQPNRHAAAMQFPREPIDVTVPIVTDLETIRIKATTWGVEVFSARDLVEVNAKARQIGHRPFQLEHPMVRP